MKMHNELTEQYILNYNWGHTWCDPNILKNIHIKEVIKGPFKKPKLLNSFLYVTVCQKDGTAIRLKEGIPDCWAEYLSHHLGLCRKYELMHKKDVDIVPQLKKNYSLYLGQGIPDPWTSHIGNFNIFSHENHENPKKHFCRLSHRRKFNDNLNKQPCLCCSKNYLFNCPDNGGTDSCSYLLKHYHDKHVPEANSNEKRKRIKILPNWFTKKSNAKQGKKKGKESSESGPPSSRGSSSSSDDENRNLNEEKSQNCMNKYFQPKACSCPYIKNFHLGNNGLKNKCVNSFLSPLPTSASKLIQAELQPIRSTKSVQTDKPNIKCSNACYYCNFYHYNTLWSVPCNQGNPPGQCEVGCPAVCSTPNFCHPPNYAQNPTFVCPYTISNHYLLHKPHKQKTKEFKKHSLRKNHHKKREIEDSFNPELRYNKTHFRNNEAEECNMKWKEKDCELLKSNYDFSRNNKNKYPYSKLTKTFDDMKYLTDDRLKNYLQREKISQKKRNIYTSTCRDSKPTNFDKETTSYFNPTRVEQEKPLPHPAPGDHKSFTAEKKISPRESKFNIINSRKLNHSDQATMTQLEDQILKKNRTKIIFFKEMVESDKSRRGRKHNESTKRKRTLLENRKKRRKLGTRRKASFLECDNILKKATKEPSCVDKEVQVFETIQNCLGSEKPSSSPSSCQNYNENKNLLCKDLNFDSEKTLNAWRSIDQIISNRHLKNFEGSKSTEILKQIPNLEKQFRKISDISGSSLSSDVLKNLVDNLFLEKRVEK